MLKIHMLVSMRSDQSLINCWWECNMVWPLFKTVCQFLMKFNI